MNTDRPHGVRGPDGVRWAGIFQLSEYLGGKSVHTLRKMAQQNVLPHYRLGRQLLFDLDQVDAVIRARESLCVKGKRKKEASGDGTDEAQRSDNAEVGTGTPAERAEASQIAADIWSEV